MSPLNIFIQYSLPAKWPELSQQVPQGGREPSEKSGIDLYLDHQKGLYCLDGKHAGGGGETNTPSGWSVFCLFSQAVTRGM